MPYYLTFLLIFIVNGLAAQVELPEGVSTEERVYVDEIASVQLFLNYKQTNYPFIDLYDAQSFLQVRFDDLNGGVRDYTFQIVHCNSDWSISDLDTFEYIEGFYEDDFYDFNRANGTMESYTTYSLQLPNNSTEFKVSGNYLIYVFADGDEEQAVFTKRFVVYENLVDLNTKSLRPNLNRYFNTHQQLSFDFKYDNLNFTIDPMNDFSVSILQNGRWDNSIIGLPPFSYRPDRILYNYSDKTLFEAGREFRYFDLRSLEFKGDRVAKIYPYNGFMQAELEIDYPRFKETTPIWKDFNGGYEIDTDARGFIVDDAEYVNVNFKLNMPEKIKEGTVYLFGGLTNWAVDKRYKLTFSEKTSNYEATIYLKQGIYNYQYIIVDNDGQKLQSEYVEGNFWRTENDYIILVYYQPFGKRYDRIIGAALVNSLR